MSQISPIILQTQIAIPAAAGELGVADSTRLENPFQNPMWLDEIRIRIPYNSGYVAYPSLYLKLMLGNIPLTNGAIPIGMLGKELNDSTDLVPDNGNHFLPGNIFTWKLPKPLFIPARDYLRPFIYQAPSGANGFSLQAWTVTICYVCRPLPKNTPTPRTLQFPWLTTYVPPLEISDGGSNVFTDRSDQSTPSDLFNPFDEPLHVQRFVGRFMEPGAQNNSDLNWMSYTDESLNATTGLVNSGCYVSAQDSFNNILIRDLTPFSHVFGFIDRSWTVNAILPPKGFYLFTIDRLWANLEAGGSTTGTVGIAMVGWRDVDYAQRQPMPGRMNR